MAFEIRKNSKEKKNFPLFCNIAARRFRVKGKCKKAFLKRKARKRDNFKVKKKGDTMKQLEILVLTPEMNEEDMYVLKFEKERKFIEKVPYYHNQRYRMIRCKTITEKRLKMLLWEAKCGYFGGWYRINGRKKMIGDKELSA